MFPGHGREGSPMFDVPGGQGQGVPCLMLGRGGGASASTREALYSEVQCIMGSGHMETLLPTALNR